MENHRPGQALVSVHDHIPVSTDGDIKVRLRETSPDPAEQNDLGELTGELSLEGGQAATIRHRFTVEHPAQVTVAWPVTGPLAGACPPDPATSPAACWGGTDRRQNRPLRRGRLGLSHHGAAGDTDGQAAEPGTCRSCGNRMFRPAV